MKADTPQVRKSAGSPAKPPPARGEVGDHLPEGKEAFGLFRHRDQWLPVVRNETRTGYFEVTDETGQLQFHSYTVWENGFAHKENFSHKQWLHLVEIGRATELRRTDG